MEERFSNINEELAKFKVRRQEIKDNCQAQCDSIQTEANEKKNEARAHMGVALIDLDKEEDDFLNNYRQWKATQIATVA